jgi:hypothetical protein
MTKVRVKQKYLALIVVNLFSKPVRFAQKKIVADMEIALMKSG